jgi:TonB family protein
LKKSVVLCILPLDVVRVCAGFEKDPGLMNNAIASLHKHLTSIVKYLLAKGDSSRGPFEGGEDVFRRYIVISVVIHLIVIIALSISYRRSVRAEMFQGAYEVSLMELEKPKPATTQRKEPPKPKPKPKPPEEKKVVIPEPKKDEVKITPKPKPKPPEEKPKEEEKKPEQKKPEPVKAPPEEAEPDSVFSPRPEPDPTPSVGGIQIDNPNFKFDYYLAMLQMKIQQNWNVPKGLPASEEGVIATVKFTIRRDGSITRVDVEESSGLRFFDQSAVRAVINAGPAPPLPRAYGEDQLGVHVNFVFKEEF